MEQEWGAALVRPQFPLCRGACPTQHWWTVPGAWSQCRAGVPCPQPPGSSGWHRAWTALRPQDGFALFLGTWAGSFSVVGTCVLWSTRQCPCPQYCLLMSPSVPRAAARVGWGEVSSTPLAVFGDPTPRSPSVDPQTLAMRSASLAPGATVWEPGHPLLPKAFPRTR